MTKTLHLMTQRNQPFGSERRCCERCGLMMVARPACFWLEHAHTDDEQLYHDNHAGHTTCATVKSAQRTTVTAPDDTPLETGEGDAR